MDEICLLCKSFVMKYLCRIWSRNHLRRIICEMVISAIREFYSAELNKTLLCERIIRNL